MDVSPLCHKVAYEPRMVVEPQGCVAKHGLLWGKSPLV